MKTKNGDEYPIYNQGKQRELFAEFLERRSKKTGHLFRQDIVLGKKVTLQLSYENLILFFIVFIMLLVVFFSLGVERGKRITSLDEKIATNRQIHKVQKELPTVEKMSGTVTSETVVGSKIKIDDVSNIVEKGSAVVSTKPYTIQVAAFKKEHYIKAEKELQRLKKDGYEVFTIPTEEWIQVCVGRYASKDESKKDFDSLRNRYPTCYVRKVNK